MVKGALTGLMLDILIRDASDNKHSLDDVLRGLYNANYKHGQGFGAHEWWSAVQHAANGKSFEEFRHRYVNDRVPLPIDSVLQVAGLRVVHDSTSIRRKTRIVVMPGASERATRIREGILYGSILSPRPPPSEVP
jgi:predicted metalloprotease with PDZ domain